MISVGARNAAVIFVRNDRMGGIIDWNNWLANVGFVDAPTLCRYSEATKTSKQHMSDEKGKPRGPKKTLLGVGMRLPPPALPGTESTPKPTLSAIADVGHDDSFDNLPADLEELSAGDLLEEASEEFEDEKTQMADLSESSDFESARTEIGAPLVEEHPSMFAKFDSKPVEAIGHLPTQALGAVEESQGPEFSLPFASTAALPSPIVRQMPAPAEDEEEELDLSDLEGLKTELINSPFESDTAVPKLLVLAGPNTGQEFFVTGLRATVGRGDTNAIIIHDLAASRQHIEILKNTDDSYSVRDLQSINGTLLNGTRIREADLFHGDRIEIGKTTFQFLIQGNAPSPSRNRRVIPAALTTSPPPADQTGAQVIRNGGPDLTRIFTAATILAGVLTLIVVVGIFWILATKNTTPDTQAPTGELAGQRYFAGVEATKIRDWESAEALFVEAAELDPNLQVEQQISRIKRERIAEKLLSEAERSVAEGDMTRAREAVAQIPSQSVYYTQAQSLIRSPKTREIDELFTEAQRDTTELAFDSAREKVQEILDRVPDHTGALELRGQIDALEAEEEEKKAQEEARRVAAATRSAPQKTGAIDPFATDAPSSSGSGKAVNFTEGFRLYRAKDFKAAEAFFEDLAKQNDGALADRARRTATNISTFEKAYGAAESALEAKKWSQAEKDFTSARRADAAVSGNRGYFFNEISKGLAEAKAARGLEQLSRKDFAKAFALQTEAQKLDSKNAKASDLQAKLLVEARNLYIKAAGERKSNPAQAAAHCRTIMTMLPKSDTTYQKAQNMLKEL